MYVCCVPDCKDKQSPRHTFPLYYEQIFNIWLERIGNVKLQGMDHKKIHKSYRLCDKHFSDFCRIPGRTKLKFGSLPTLFLANFHQESTEQNSLFKYPIKQPEISQDNIPSTSSQSDATQTQPGEKIRIVSDIQIFPPKEPPTIVLPEIRHEVITPPLPAIQPERSLLQSVNVTRMKQLTPKARRMYEEVRKLKKVKRRLEMTKASCKVRLQNAADLLQTPFTEKVVNSVTRNFFFSQLSEQKKHPRGRRFTVDDKIFALSVMKQSYKGYRLLQKVFALPSRKTLLNLLHDIQLSEGTNKHILHSLKQSVENMGDMDRYCCLIFDEMALSPGLQYNGKDDKIVGFANETSQFADHVLVFMLRGIRRRWKQPISFYFVEHCTSSSRLKVLIKETIQEVEAIGLHVVATICDQGTNNRAAINMLLKDSTAEFGKRGKENTNFGFVVNGREVIPLYDPPHLLKGIRNNMLTKNITFKRNEQQYEASWQDVTRLYELSNRYENKKLCPKWTDQHILPEKMAKMKVAYAAHVFSQRATAIMNFAADCGQLPASAHGTAEFLQFIDEVFDSVNGFSLYPPPGKPLHTAITTDSPHVNFWYDAIKVFESIHFLNAQKQVCTPPPTIKNWIWTLKGLHRLWTNLESKGFQFLTLRNLNQDPLENFFGCIRSHGVRNVNPTCTAFIHAFKTMLINNFMHPHSPAANCEADDSEGALNTLRYFLGKVPLQESTEPSPVHLELTLPAFSETGDYVERNMHSYMAGFIAKRVYRNHGQCRTCKNLLISETREGPYSELIRRRAYTSKMLCVPGTLFSRVFSEVFFYCEQLVPEICNKPSIRGNLVYCIKQELSKYFIHCDQHDLLSSIVESIVSFYIVSWIKTTTRILHGRCNQISPSADVIKKKAFDKFTKSRKRKGA